MSCFVQYAPYKLRPGLNWDEQREAFGDNVINTIAEYAPNIKEHHSAPAGRHAARSGTRVGPDAKATSSRASCRWSSCSSCARCPGYAQFRTPIKNLYMCGSATHPGGGIMGAPGRLAALEILKDSKGAA